MVVPRTQPQTGEYGGRVKEKTMSSVLKTVGAINSQFVVRERLLFTSNDIPTYKLQKENYTITWLPVNATKRIKHQFCGASFSIIFWKKKLDKYTTLRPLSKMLCDFYFIY